MKLELTDKLHLRFDASRTLTRPGLNLMTPVASVGTGQRVGALTASGGSPALKPYLSDNFDIAAEWYYQPNSYRSEEHTSELQSLMRISYAVFCLNKKK